MEPLAIVGLLLIVIGVTFFGAFTAFRTTIENQHIKINTLEQRLHKEQDGRMHDTGRSNYRHSATKGHIKELEEQIVNLNKHIEIQKVLILPLNEATI